MKPLVIRQSNGLYAVYSVVAERLIAVNLTPDDLAHQGLSPDKAHSFPAQGNELPSKAESLPLKIAQLDVILV